MDGKTSQKVHVYPYLLILTKWNKFLQQVYNILMYAFIICKNNQYFSPLVIVSKIITDKRLFHINNQAVYGKMVSMIPFIN